MVLRVARPPGTRRLGALDDSFLGVGLSLGKARLLFEIGAGLTEVRRLREKLDLDSGQMSRLLRSLEQRGLIKTSVARADARARTVALTRAGRAKLAELDRKSNEGALSARSSRRHCPGATARGDGDGGAHPPGVGGLDRRRRPA